MNTKFVKIQKKSKSPITLESLHEDIVKLTAIVMENRKLLLEHDELFKQHGWK